MLAVILAAPAVQAQNNPAPKLYRWTDKDGKEHYTDSLPAEAVDAARAELNKASGSTVSKVERAMTDDERAQKAREAEAAAAAAKIEADRLQNDRTLLSSYSSESELQKTYSDRLILVEESVKSAQVGINSQRGSLASLLAHATDRELAGQAVDARTLENLGDAHRQLGEQKIVLQRREAERNALQNELDDLLARYRELKANPPVEPGGSTP
ncbi:MAG: DUF4124 domain-containing protein [Xanthomonadaceae bacterium]|nr:DUF4124 domain-containing protein [Xanthomonadaceae bacterium]MDZ4377928.1 DUF4124 domain-containing protein [Xanthomonadaceae bacterium]